MPHININKNINNPNQFLNRLVLVMAIAEPLMTLPQVYEIWVKRQTTGVSLATWSFFTISAIIWLIYGLKIKSRPIIVSSTLWILVEGSIVVGLLAH